MSYRKDREEFVARFMSMLPNVEYHERFDAAMAFLRDATAEQRWNEISCSIDIGERETARMEKRSEARMGRVRARCVLLGVGLEENGDPRGWPLCLLVGPDKIRLGVPANGLPARCFQ